MEYVTGRGFGELWLQILDEMPLHAKISLASEILDEAIDVPEEFMYFLQLPTFQQIIHKLPPALGHRLGQQLIRLYPTPLTDESGIAVEGSDSDHSEMAATEAVMVEGWGQDGDSDEGDITPPSQPSDNLLAARDEEGDEDRHECMTINITPHYEILDHSHVEKAEVIEIYVDGEDEDDN